MSDIVIKTLILGKIDTNCYLVMNKKNREILIIDPAAQAGDIENQIQKVQAIPTAILLTHGHFDHMMAAEELKEKYHIPVYACEQEQEVLESAKNNLSAAWASAYSMKADFLVSDEEELNLAGIRIVVLHTPGHTKGSICFYLSEEGILFSGDTLFAESYGRTDLLTGSMQQMRESISRLLTILPDNTKVYPGHGQTTEISVEKRYNPLA
ncbi:MBL fold metallo-hydrolase [Blautia liquoris]|uniref:MBL fold metallo-hydrolase n=1 Tax=Blautia liquoris TaxID=2779518 RepID=A0A7M2RKH1_9FIRM|nr:MBL fold metallo-hydrolase [Blautia liquoris]QOV20846.1 MBL fold metallo-hydrolase [Blautia liquoris]